MGYRLVGEENTGTKNYLNVFLESSVRVEAEEV